jgi:hypothetical protein
MRASRWDVKPAGRVKAKRVGSVQSCTGQRTTATPRLASADEAQAERSCWDPKDGELCEARSKPEETLVEDCSGSNVQIDRRSFV